MDVIRPRVLIRQLMFSYFKWWACNIALLTFWSADWLVISNYTLYCATLKQIQELLALNDC